MPEWTRDPGGSRACRKVRDTNAAVVPCAAVPCSFIGKKERMMAVPSPAPSLHRCCSVENARLQQSPNPMRSPHPSKQNGIVKSMALPRNHNRRCGVV